jgi:UDP-N-acetylmuramoylalanine--D-glutamate ligase
VKYLNPGIQAAAAQGVEVSSSSAFFLDQAHCPVIGVTGTKGKGTTCSLIFEMLQFADEDVYLGGNIGKPAISFLDKIKGDSVAVLELSSFQLQDFIKGPKYAVLLNTTTDHLDYHADRGEYLRAKEQLLTKQPKDSVAVLNKDYDYVKYYEPLVKGDLRYVSVKGAVKDGAYVKGGDKDGEIISVSGGKEEKICDVADVALMGSHNLENILPAVVIAREFGVDIRHIKRVIKEFEGLPHRLEFVKEVKGVRYYNDSFSTTAETSMAAVDSFDEPTVLIAGGFDKGLDYSEWALKILTKPSLKVVILIGDTAKDMDKAIIEADEKLGEAEGSPTKVLLRKDLEEAVLEAYAQVEKGGVVVMSPASSSFGLFENYKERGRVFREAVGKLR